MGLAEVRNWAVQHRIHQHVCSGKVWRALSTCHPEHAEHAELSPTGVFMGFVG